MKGLQQKIKAFTLTEVMVVLVISAIVVGLAFSVLGIVQKNMSNIQGNYQYQSEIQSLEVALSIDFNTYSSAHWNSEKNQLTLSSPIQQKKYHFFNDSIVSNTTQYKTKVKSTTFYFEGEQVPSGRIDAIKLIFDKTTDTHRVFVFKHNDPSIHF